MHCDVNIQSRDEMIALGHHIGVALKSQKREKPWIISLTGDEASGKELLALAIDQVFNPDNYTQGIESTMSADRQLTASKRGSVVFNNFRRPIYSTKDSFDRALKEYEGENHASLVLIASNIERTFTGEFDYRAKGLQSDALDISLQVHKKEGTFSRHIAITLKDEAMIEKIVQSQAPSRIRDKNSSFPI